MTAAAQGIENAVAMLAKKLAELSLFGCEAEYPVIVRSDITPSPFSTTRLRNTKTPVAETSSGYAVIVRSDKPLSVPLATRLPATQTLVAEAGSRTPAFLRLPPEIRNVIYEMVLISPSLIDLTRRFQQPALLRTSRLLRSETYQMWHKRNEFSVVVNDCDARLLSSFCRHYGQYLPPSTCPVQICGRPHWANLVAWCMMVLSEKTMLGLSSSASCSNKYGIVIEGAVNLAISTRRSQGTRQLLENLLGSYRRIAGLVDPRWLDDL